LQIHKYFLKCTYVQKHSDTFRVKRRKALDKQDEEGYKYYVLS
jgi:hypothetical protein